MSHEDPRAMACVRLMISFQGCVSVFVFFLKKKMLRRNTRQGSVRKRPRATKPKGRPKSLHVPRVTGDKTRDAEKWEADGNEREREVRGAGGGGGREAGAAKHEPTRCARGEHV